MTREEVARRTRTHLFAFAAIVVVAVLAAITVVLEKPPASAGVVIAVLQAMMVLKFMMHLYDEGPWVKWLVAFSIVSVIGLAGTLCVGYFDTIEGTQHVIAAPVEQAQDAEH